MRKFVSFFLFVLGLACLISCGGFGYEVTPVSYGDGLTPDDPDLERIGLVASVWDVKVDDNGNDSVLVSVGTSTRLSGETLYEEKCGSAPNYDDFTYRLYYSRGDYAMIDYGRNHYDRINYSEGSG